MNVAQNGEKASSDALPAAADSRPVVVDSQALAIISQMLRGMKFGHIQVIVRDGVVVQLDRTERRRLREKK